MSDQTPTTPDRTTIFPSPTSDEEPEELAAAWSEGQFVVEEMQRVRAMCAAVTETVEGARMLLEETYRNCVSLSSMVAMLQRQLAESVSGASRRDSGRGSQPRLSVDEGKRVRGRLDLATLERARLEGALLVARTAAHLVSNDLTATVGLTEMARGQIKAGTAVDLKLLDDAIASAKRAARHLQDLQEIAGLEFESGYGTTLSVLDLALSKRPAKK